MEGACVYKDYNNSSILLMYKEIDNNNILLLKYYDSNLNINYISINEILYYIPDNCIHILYALPILDDIETTIWWWKSLALNKLNMINKLTDNANNINYNNTKII